jgi:acyl-CoA thioesterase
MDPRRNNWITMTQPADEIAHRCAEVIWAMDKTSQALGMTLAGVGPGRSELGMLVRDDMVNAHGTCHGGYIFTLADSAFSYAAGSHDERTVAQHCTITYVAPAACGSVLTARAVEVSRAGRSGIYDITVTDADGTLIAVFRGNSRTIGGPIITGQDAST